MVIQHNLSGLNANRIYGIKYRHKTTLSEKLSSGYRINRSADDAAGLAVSEKIRRQIRGLTQAAANAQDGVSLVQSAEGALHEVHDMLQRMNELAIRAANGTNAMEDRGYLQEEIAQIIREVDRVAETTTFNEGLLLDGRYGKGVSNINQTSPKITVYDISYHITNAVKPMHPNVQPAEWTNVVNVLKDQIVPQAITSLLGTFSDTFGYLNGVNIGIGLQMAERDDSPTVASVTLTSAYIAGTPAIVDLGYTLSVNMSFVSLDSNNQITEASRRNLESVITHEMMHGLMMEALTAGMAGRDENMNIAQGFPTWFVEGTAQAAGGGASDVRFRLRIDENSSEADVRAALQAHKLGSGTGNSLYGTGYLATMYLGYLAAGGNSMAAADIASGIDRIMYEVRGGKSLSQAIADNTNQRYTSLSDFEARFAQDGAAFSKQLLGLSGNGYGALVGGNYSSENILADATMIQPVFTLYPNHETVYNEYKEGYDFLEGGLANAAGPAGGGHPNYVGNTGGGTTPGTGGNQGTGGTTPGTGGNQGTGGTTPGGGGNQGTGGTTPGGGGNQGTGGTTPGTTPGAGGLAAKVGGGLYLQVGSEPGQRIRLYIEAMNSAAIGIDQVNISTEEGAQNAVDIVKKAIAKVSEQRAELGACQNRLECTINNLENIIENTTAAESRIRDADMAKLMVEYSNNSILLQAGQAMLARANESREFLLGLLQ